MKRASRTGVSGIGMMKSTHPIIAMLVLAGPSLVVAGCTLSTRPAADAPPADAYQTPAITLATIDELRALIEAGKGSPVVVNLWATWCPPCVTEMPALARFYDRYNELGVTFLSFSGDDPETIADHVLPFVNSYEIPFPVWVMENAEAEALNAGLGIDWDGLYPTTYLFAPDGTLTQTWEGQVTQEALSEAVEALGGAGQPTLSDSAR